MASNVKDDGSKCPICFEIYKEPKALVCLHTFCETCIHEYVLKSKEKGLLCNGIECPLCRYVTTVEENTSPETWAKGLRPNFALASLLDSTTSSQESTKEEEMNCQPCLMQNITKIASVFCSVCNERMCESCKKVHDSLQLTKNHESVDIDSKENVELSTTLRTYQKCDNHGKKIKFYCKDDDKLCCSTCAIVTHRACQGLAEISEMAMNRQVKLQGTLLRKQIAEMENTMKLSSSHFVNENKHLATQAAELLTEWNQVKEKVNKRLDEFEDGLKEDLKAIQSTGSSDIIANAVKCNEMAEEMRRLLLVLKSCKKTGTEEQQCVVMKKIYDEFMVRQSETEQKFGEMKKLKLSLELPETISDLLSLPSKSVTVATETCTTHVPKCSAKTLSVLAEADIEEGEDDDAEPFYRGLGFLNDGRIVAVDYRNNKLILMDNKLNEIAAKRLLDIPLNLAVTHDDCVIITTGVAKKICIYQVNEDNTINEKKIIPVKYSCDSISITSDNKCVVGTFGSDVEPAHLLTFYGESEDMIYDFEGMFFEKSNRFKSVYNANDRQLLITDKWQSKVQIYNLQKETIIFEDSNIRNPNGIAHYLNDLFFVCSSGTNSIVQLSSQGEILTINGLDKVISPYSVCISPSKDRMIVSNNRLGEKKLILFQIH
ncbi:uncharacterized protein LOC132726582 [Ruditapes philippinarum]|uniref:uncharacterized protein LOC132726582 n=1 Tax=Ruditapes philippinarum TaxID=129788 RepID=UPI00295B24B7|nr:uncharacterized protein LOC132726582 [Ruditapes philippinarum]